jgi:hypothetical protein
MMPTQNIKEVIMNAVKFYALSITFFAALLFAGCSTISVHQDYNPAYDFSKLKTYGFLPIPAEAGIDQLNAQRLGNAIEASLTKKGYALSSDKPDFGVALFFSSKTKTDITSYGYGYGYGHWGMGMGDVDVQQYDVGTLVIDFIDLEKQELIWRGSGQGILKENPSVEERTKNINKAVDMIIDQFPPEKAQ